MQLEQERKNRQSITSTTTATKQPAKVAAKPTNLNASLNNKLATAKANPLNSTVKLPKTTDEKMVRTNSSSRLGLTKDDPKTPAPKLTREGSTSRLGLGGQTARNGSTTRGTVERSGAATARGVSKEKVDLNSTLTKKTTALNTTQRLSKTPLKEPTAQTTVKPTPSKVTAAPAKVVAKTNPTPLDYKKMEALLIEKSSEIQCLKEEIQGL